MLRSSGQGQRALAAEARRAEMRMARAMRARDSAQALATRDDTERARTVLRGAEKELDKRRVMADEAWDRVWRSAGSMAARVNAAPDVIWWAHVGKDKETLVAYVLAHRMATGVKYSTWEGDNASACMMTLTLDRREENDETPRNIQLRVTNWECRDKEPWIDVWATVWWGIARTTYEMRIGLGPNDVEPGKRAKRTEKEEEQWTRFCETLGKEGDDLVKFMTVLVRRTRYSYLTSGLYRDALQRKFPECVWPGVERSAK